MQSSYCPSPYRYTRRVTREVMVGNVGVGGANPIRVQSMLTSDTRDTDACVKEALELADRFLRMIRGEATEAEKESLDEAAILEDVSHMPARVKCATLGWHTIQEMLKDKEA